MQVPQAPSLTKLASKVPAVSQIGSRRTRDVRINFAHFGERREESVQLEVPADLQIVSFVGGGNEDTVIDTSRMRGIRKTA
jgi:hypothetical protein